MKNNKGQALVEFVVIMPIFIMLLISIIDLGNIIYKKYHLENDLDYIVDLYRLNKISEINTYSNNKGFNTRFETYNDTVTIILEKNIEIQTPGLNLVLSNPYKITVDRVIYNE